MDDINTMHRYRDAIVYENADSRFTFEKTMFGAYILFPYGDENEYRGAEHHDKDGNVVHGRRFYRSIDSVNIGGLGRAEAWYQDGGGGAESDGVYESFPADEQFFLCGDGLSGTGLVRHYKK